MKDILFFWRESLFDHMGALSREAGGGGFSGEGGGGGGDCVCGFNLWKKKVSALECF